MRPIMWGENTWRCGECGAVETAPEAPDACWECEPAGESSEATYREGQAVFRLT